MKVKRTSSSGTTELKQYTRVPVIKENEEIAGPVYAPSLAEDVATRTCAMKQQRPHKAFEPFNIPN